MTIQHNIYSQFFIDLSKAFRLCNINSNPKGTQVNDFSTRSDEFCGTNFSNAADERVLSELNKLGGRIIKSSLTKKLGNISDFNATSIYKGLLSQGKIPPDTPDVLARRIDEIERANMAAFLEKSSIKDIKATYGEDSQITKIILFGKNESNLAKRFNYFANLNEPYLRMLNDVSKDSPLAKYFDFNGDVTLLKVEEDLRELGVFRNNAFKPYVVERIKNYKTYAKKLNYLIDNFTAHELGQASLVGANPHLNQSSQGITSNPDSFLRSSYPLNMPRVYRGNPYAYSDPWRNPFYSPNINNGFTANNSTDDYYNSL